MSLDPLKNEKACELVAKALGAKIAVVSVRYPQFFKELAEHQCVGKFPLTIALATVGVENPGFDVIRERGAQSYFIEHYWKNANVRKNLGNTKESDAYTYCGRGLIQLTGRYNYEKYGRLLQLDLLTKPDLALEPVTAMRIFRAYFQDHGLDVWANRWGNAANGKDKEASLQKCRKLVNGGLNGYEKFKKLAEHFVAIA